MTYSCDKILWFLETIIRLACWLKGDLTGQPQTAPPFPLAPPGFPLLSPPNVPAPCETASYWLNFDDETKTVHWDGGHCRFCNRKYRRYLFVRLLWESDSFFADLETITDIVGDRARPSWHAVRMLGHRTEHDDLSPVECPFAILQEREGFRLIHRL